MRTTRKRQQHIPHFNNFQVSSCYAAPDAPARQILLQALGRSGSKLLLPGLRCFPFGRVEALDHPGAVAAVRCVQHGQVRRDVQYEEVHKQVANLVADAAGHLSTDTHTMQTRVRRRAHVTSNQPAAAKTTSSDVGQESCSSVLKRGGADWRLQQVHAPVATVLLVL